MQPRGPEDQSRANPLCSELLLGVILPPRKFARWERSPFSALYKECYCHTEPLSEHQVFPASGPLHVPFPLPGVSFL